ncbi:helix-turn-helix domain-containing protein [Endothiovibrio diazotrophicus]
MSIQVIRTESGEPEYAVVPYAEYERLREAAEIHDDIRDYDRIKARLASGEEELIPAEVAHRLADGENPIRVWREYRGLTGSALAERASISQGYLSQIETGEREGKVSVIRSLAVALGVDMEDLLRD